jgi:hypothetical protein
VDSAFADCTSSCRSRMPTTAVHAHGSTHTQRIPHTPGTPRTHPPSSTTTVGLGDWDLGALRLVHGREEGVVEVVAHRRRLAMGELAQALVSGVGACVCVCVSCRAKPRHCCARVCSTAALSACAHPSLRRTVPPHSLQGLGTDQHVALASPQALEDAIGACVHASCGCLYSLCMVCASCSEMRKVSSPFPSIPPMTNKHRRPSPPAPLPPSHRRRGPCGSRGPAVLHPLAAQRRGGRAPCV